MGEMGVFRLVVYGLIEVKEVGEEGMVGDVLG